MADLAQNQLPPFSAHRLGGERAQAAVTLRGLFRQAGLPESPWPHWIDARPGLLSGIWVDGDAEPPLGQLFASLCIQYGELLIDGLSALKLALAAQTVGFCTSSPAVHAELLRLCAKTTIAVQSTVAAFPSLPEPELPPSPGRAWVVSPQLVVAVGAIVRRREPPRLCSVVGAVKQPQVLDLACAGIDAAETAWTPRELVRRCFGSTSAAWVALVGGALTGIPWQADAPLPTDVSHLLVLPADHELISRRRLLHDPTARISNACLSCDLCSAFCPESIRPHVQMQALARKQPLPSGGLSGCTGCGACSVVCPAGLLPASLLINPAVPRPVSAQHHADEPPPLPEGRLRIPTELLLSRLGLLDYLPR